MQHFPRKSACYAQHFRLFRAKYAQKLVDSARWCYSVLMFLTGFSVAARQLWKAAVSRLTASTMTKESEITLHIGIVYLITNTSLSLKAS